MRSGRSREFWCPVVSEPVLIRLTRLNRLMRPGDYFVQCNQAHCQYVEVNAPPCPLHVSMFAGGPRSPPSKVLKDHRRDRKRPDSKRHGREPAIAARIFVGNLTFGTTADTLTALLSEAGSVVEVYLPADRETGRPRGFAFVQFASESEAAAAIQLFHDREVEGRRLTVNAAEDRSLRPTGPRPFDPRHAIGGNDRPTRSFKRKGSRRGLRGRKRSL
jgi:cold-inducible RNA-binding protein